MSIRGDMLRLAAAGAERLPGGREPVVEFLLARRTDDGGFRGRGEASDLYYDAFAAQALAALGAECPARFPDRLRECGDGGSLDLVHLAALIRCRSIVDPPAGRKLEAMRRRVEAFRADDGGYADEPGADHGSAYGCFLALGALQDLGVELPDADGVARCIDSLRSGGGYVNDPTLPVAMAPSTAAAVVALTRLGRVVDPETLDWLLSLHRSGGGIAAAEGIEEPDLLSTATAMTAVVTAGGDVSPVAEPCASFACELYADGGFRGNLRDHAADCEFTFYGLLALGCAHQPSG